MFKISPHIDDDDDDNDCKDDDDYGDGDEKNHLENDISIMNLKKKFKKTPGELFKDGRHLNHVSFLVSLTFLTLLVQDLDIFYFVFVFFICILYLLLVFVCCSFLCARNIISITKINVFAFVFCHDLIG